MDLKLFSIYCYALLNIGVYGKNARLIGGVTATIHDFPHIVSFRLYSSNVHFCAGSIISHKHVLSAAHCFMVFKNAFNNIRMYSGTSSSVDTTGNVFTIAYIVFHEDFTGVLTLEDISPHDIAIVKVNEYIEYNAVQNKINLPTRDIFAGNLGLVAGWGVTSYPNGDLSPSLRQAPTNIYTHSFCVDRIPVKIMEYQMCSWSRIGVGTCAGDSGGPLVSNNELYGIISFSFQCADGVPEVLTKVYYYLDFIRPYIEGY